MKKQLLLLGAVLAAGSLMAQKTVNVETAGTLGTLLTADEQKNLTHLTVTGELNSNDVKILRAMTKTKANRFSPGLVGFGVLEDLDLSGAEFVKDTNPYFSDNDNMEDYGTTPNQVGPYMFFNSMTLKRFVAPDGTTAVGAGAFENAEYLEDFICSSLIRVFGANCFAKCTQLTPLSLEGARSLGASCFQGNLKITDVELSNDVTSFSGNSFTGCTNLQTVKIGTGITVLESYSFNNLPSLKYVEVSPTLTQVYPNSFNDCVSLETFVCPVNVPPTTPNLSYAKGPFDNLPATAVLKVPAQSVPSYQAATHWSKFQTIEAIGSSTVCNTFGVGEGNCEYYTLQGVRVNAPVKGLYLKVCDGKTGKVMVK